MKTVYRSTDHYMDCQIYNATREWCNNVITDMFFDKYSFTTSTHISQNEFFMIFGCRQYCSYYYIGSTILDQ